MTEQTTLNVEQEAFLSYQAAIEAHKQHSIKDSFLWNEYSRLSDEASAAFAVHHEFSKGRNALVDAEFNASTQWRSVRGY